MGTCDKDKVPVVAVVERGNKIRPHRNVKTKEIHRQMPRRRGSECRSLYGRPLELQLPSDRHRSINHNSDKYRMAIEAELFLHPPLMATFKGVSKGEVYTICSHYVNKTKNDDFASRPEFWTNCN